MRFVGCQRLCKCFGWKLLVFTLVPVFVFIAFDVLDLDGSDLKAFRRNGFFVAQTEQDDFVSNDKGEVLSGKPYEMVRFSITTGVPGSLRPHATERGIRQSRILARRDVSEGNYQAEQPTADPA